MNDHDAAQSAYNAWALDTTREGGPLLPFAALEAPLRNILTRTVAEARREERAQAANALGFTTRAMLMHLCSGTEGEKMITDAAHELTEASLRVIRGVVAGNRGGAESAEPGAENL